MARVHLAGSTRAAVKGAHCLGPCDPDQVIEVSVIVRRQDEAQFRARVMQLERGGDPSAPPMSREAFAQRFGASAGDLMQVRQFAHQHGLVVVETDAARRCVMLSGTVAQFNAAFGVALHRYANTQGRAERGAPSQAAREPTPQGEFRAREGAIGLPDDLQDIVLAVLGLDTRPQARTHIRFRPPIRAAASGANAYSPVQLASLYRFPAGTGAGQCVGLIELGGGYNASDLQTYFAGLHLPVPAVVTIGVDGGRNSPTGDPSGADGEVMLDLELAGAIAPQARLAVYFAGNTDTGFVDAVSRAVHDRTNRPSVISISWGGPESAWTGQAIQAFDAVLQEAATLGVTVCVASGDSGSTDGVSDRSNHVDFPASSPWVLGCGGTRLHASGNAIESEVVWNDGLQGGAGGGGVSTVFPVPAWQQGLSVRLSTGQATALTQRGVPDVAGDADPATGYTVLIDGTETVVGGTSAVAPLWAGLIARLNAARAGSGAQTTPVGFINPRLYAHPGACNDITQGNNGAYMAAAGWDACTGLGSPIGTEIAAAL